MTIPWRKILKNAGPVLFALLLILAFSGLHARHICRQRMETLIDTPSCDLGLVFYPSRHIADAPNLGFAPGWLVTFVPPGNRVGTAFFVTFLGKIKARGTPMIVATQQKEAARSLEQFQRDFAKLDAAVSVGSSYQKALAILGEPMHTLTNGDSSMTAFFDYDPLLTGRIAIKWLTNGISLTVSNGIILHKGYSYLSSQ